jgi:hypothetical protein
MFAVKTAAVAVGDGRKALLRKKRCRPRAASLFVKLNPG